MAVKSLPSQEYLRQCLDYNPETGILTWRERPLWHFKDARAHKIWNTRYARHDVLCINRQGYVQISIDNVRWLAHRIIWKWMTGKEPDETIDHHNRYRSCNRWENLRQATYAEQAYNMGNRQQKELPFKGVTFMHGGYRHRPYSADIKLHGRKIFLGYYATAEEAHEAYCKAARKYFGDFWSDGKTHS